MNFVMQAHFWSFYVNSIKILRGSEDDSLVKALTFNDDPIHVPGPYTTLRNAVMKRENIDEREFHARAHSNLI